MMLRKIAGAAGLEELIPSVDSRSLMDGRQKTGPRKEVRNIPAIMISTSTSWSSSVGRPLKKRFTSPIIFVALHGVSADQPSSFTVTMYVSSDFAMRRKKSRDDKGNNAHCLGLLAIFLDKSIK